MNSNFLQLVFYITFLDIYIIFAFILIFPLLNQIHLVLSIIFFIKILALINKTNIIYYSAINKILQFFDIFFCMILNTISYKFCFNQ